MVVTNNDPKSRAIEDYFTQMRSAGFSDGSIVEKLRKTGSIFVPNVAQEGGAWAGGMNTEFTGATEGSDRYTFGGTQKRIPSPNQYLDYKPGRPADRLPSYSEFSGRDTGLNTGVWGDTKRANLATALQNYSANYEGPRVKQTQEFLGAGIAGLPQDIGQQYYQEFLGIAKEKAEGIGVKNR